MQSEAKAVWGSEALLYRHIFPIQCPPVQALPSVSWSPYLIPANGQAVLVPQDRHLWATCRRLAKPASGRLSRGTRCMPGIGYRGQALSKLGRRVQSGIRYPVVVRFPTVNYAGVSTNNYALDEVEAA